MTDRKDEERELHEFADDPALKKDLRTLNEGVDAQRTNDPLDPLNWPFGLKVSSSQFFFTISQSTSQLLDNVHHHLAKNTTFVREG